MSIKRYSNRHSLSTFLEPLKNFSARPNAPLSLDEKIRVIKNSNTFKALGLLFVCIVGVGFYFGSKSTNTPRADSITTTTYASVTSTSQAKQKLIIYVTGAVNKPGVVELDDQSRVFQAIELAGGATANANVSGCDLAAKVVDGTTIFVPSLSDQNTACTRVGTTAGTSSSGTTGGAANSVVNLNSATQVELESLPGVGPTLANSIMAYRDENGGFKSVNDLRKVSGIGDKKFSDLKDLVTI